MARMRQACAQLSVSVHCTYDMLVDLERATKFIEIQGDLELLDRLEKKLSFGRSKNSLKPRRSLLKLIRCLHSNSHLSYDNYSTLMLCFSARCCVKLLRCLHLFSHMLQENHLMSMLCLLAHVARKPFAPPTPPKTSDTALYWYCIVWCWCDTVNSK